MFSSRWTDLCWINSLDEEYGGFQDYWNFSREKRLAYVAGSEFPFDFHELIDWSLTSPDIGESDLLEVVDEYIQNPSVTAYLKTSIHDDPISDVQRQIDLSGLWRLLPKSPRSIAICLAKYIPCNFEIEEDVLESLLKSSDNFRVLFTLLVREDFVCRAFREKIYEGDFDETLKEWAGHYHLF